MSKKRVVILSVVDWAGSQYQAHAAINSVGEYDCRHITMYTHPFEFPTDVVVPLYPNKKTEVKREVVRTVQSDSYGEAVELIAGADLIHLWNTYPGDAQLMAAGLPIPFEKVRVVTMTGTLYRENHRAINTQSLIPFGRRSCKVTVQNPMLKFEDEIPSTFIPHAVDMNLFKPSEDRDKTVGTYKSYFANPGKNYQTEVDLFRKVVDKFPGWKLDLDYSLPWKERIEKLARCGIFVQDVGPFIGYWGRSTLEACALGVPCLQNYDVGHVNVLSEGKLGDIPLVRVDWDTVESGLNLLIKNMDNEHRGLLGKKVRAWVEKHYSYPVVGKMYSDLYAELL